MFTGARIYLFTTFVVAAVAVALGEIGYAIGLTAVALFAYPKIKKRDERNP